MDIEKLRQTVESVGCTLRTSFHSEIETIYILLPDRFPWYGADFDKIRKNSQIIARVEIRSQECKWKVWTVPSINNRLNTPGIEMVNDDASEALLLKNSNYEQIATWLVEKIGEVSKKAKECRKLMIACQSKEYIK